MDELLDKQAIHFVRVSESTINRGRRTIELIEIRCSQGSGEVTLVIEKMRDKSRANILLIPSRRFFFWRNGDSDALAEHLAKLLENYEANDN